MLFVVLQDQYANVFLHDANMTFSVPLHRAVCTADYLIEPTVGGRSVRTARVEVLLMFSDWIILIGNPFGSIRPACLGSFFIVVLVSKKICGKDSLQ